MERCVASLLEQMDVVTSLTVASSMLPPWQLTNCRLPYLAFLGWLHSETAVQLSALVSQLHPVVWLQLSMDLNTRNSLAPLPI